MLKVIQNKSVLNDDVKDNSIIIVKNNIYKYKEKYIGKDILVTNMISFIQKYNNKKMPKDSVNFILMKRAFDNVNDKLKIYNNINDLSFVSSLISTYSFYMENKILNNDKYHDLKIIYDEYERLIKENGFETIYDLYNNIDINDISYGTIYFENVDSLTCYDISLINKLKDKKEVIIYANTVNNDSLINDLNIKYESVNNDDINNLFKPSSKELFSKINIISCSDLYEEIKYISLDIKRKINNGLKYKDILVISPDIKRYNSYFETVFDMPYEKEENSVFLVKNFIISLKKILDGDFSSNNFLNILKMDLLDVKKEDVYLLDNYIYIWDLGDDAFYKPFIFNPSGKKDFTLNDKKILDKLNNLKIDIINPFRCLLENINNVDDKNELLKYLFMFLEEIKVTEKLANNNYDDYNLLINLFEDLYDYMPDKINITDILDYLINIISINKNKIKNQDEVNVLSLDNYVDNDYKAVYLIGLTEKDIPFKYHFNTLFNSDDLDDDALFNLIKRKNDFVNNKLSNVLLNDNVIITYHKLNDENKVLSKSPVLNKFKNKETEFNYAINKKKKNNLNKKIDKSLALKLYEKELNLSPSSLEIFAKCKYAFFLNYGLRLKTKEKLVFDAREVGTFVHYILENAVKDKIKEDEIKTKVDTYTDNYLKENNYVNNDVLKYVIKELKVSTCLLLEVIFDELKTTKLNPEKEELNLKENPLKIMLDDGILNVSGIVDRLDSYIENNCYYFRIIDYKTGSKKFKLDDVLIGLNMQMLIYLTLIKENKSNLDAVPTGILYFPALIHYGKEKAGTSIVDAKANLKDSIKMNGFVSSDETYLYNEEMGKYIDVTSRNKINEEKVLSDADINDVMNYIKMLLKEEGNSILNGDISINPIMDNKNDSCKYCLFNGICKFNKLEDKPRRYKSLKKEEVLSKMKETLRR